jgi:hypothetical protein
MVECEYAQSKNFEVFASPVKTLHFYFKSILISQLCLTQNFVITLYCEINFIKSGGLIHSMQPTLFVNNRYLPVIINLNLFVAFQHDYFTLKNRCNQLGRGVDTIGGLSEKGDLNNIDKFRGGLKCVRIHSN